MNEEVKQRLSEIEAANDGRLTPEAVVDDARDPSSPLHGLFEWDVEKAAYAQWLHRARAIISSIRVEIVTDLVTLRAPAYVRDPRLPAKEQGYAAVSSLRASVDAAREAALNELRFAEAALTRAHAVAAALHVQDEVAEVRERVRRIRDRVSGQVEALAG